VADDTPPFDPFQLERDLQGIVDGYVPIFREAIEGQLGPLLRARSQRDADLAELSERLDAPAAQVNKFAQRLAGDMHKASAEHARR
jgi:hypothetical protein